MMIPFLLSLIMAPHLYSIDVVHCYDGDTCTATIDLGMGVKMHNQKLRLCDINAPEIRNPQTRAKGIKARDYLNTILGVGVARGSVKALIHGKGKFGRWLADLYVDGKSVNSLLLKGGLAKPYKLKCK